MLNLQDRARRKGKDVRPDSKFTGRKRKDKFWSETCESFLWLIGSLAHPVLQSRFIQIFSNIQFQRLVLQIRSSLRFVLESCSDLGKHLMHLMLCIGKGCSQYSSATILDDLKTLISMAQLPWRRLSRVPWWSGMWKWWGSQGSKGSSWWYKTIQLNSTTDQGWQCLARDQGECYQAA